MSICQFLRHTDIRTYGHTDIQTMLTVLTYPDKRLRVMAKEIPEASETVRDLAKEMLETMYAQHGIGLAAPQVGEGIRLIVLDVPLVDPVNPQNRISDAIAMINPVILKAEGNVQSDEGCLSCPELIVTVDRADRVVVKFQSLEGKPSRASAQGLKAICIPHQIDHLNGILLVDKLGRLDRDFYKKKRVRQARGEKELAAIL